MDQLLKQFLDKLILSSYANGNISSMDETQLPVLVGKWQNCVILPSRSIPLEFQFILIQNFPRDVLSIALG